MIILIDKLIHKINQLLYFNKVYVKIQFYYIFHKHKLKINIYL